MSIVSKLMSAIRGGGKPRLGVAPAGAAEPPHVIPTVKFDPARVTEAVKADLKKNIRKIKEFDESHFDRIFDAALRSISRGTRIAIFGRLAGYGGATSSAQVSSASGEDPRFQPRMQKPATRASRCRTEPRNL